jgi:hypothetical protein
VFLAFLTAAYQEKKIINDLAKIQIILEYKRQMPTNLFVFQVGSSLKSSFFESIVPKA